MLIVGLVLSLIFAAGPTRAAAAQASAQSASLSGRVIDEGTGAPISSARVILFAQTANAPTRPIQAITDQDGRYTFEDVAPGRYRVDVQKSGLVPRANPGRAPAVTLAAGQFVDDWNVPVQRGGAIAGRILDPFGEPLVDITVRASGNALPARVQSTPPPRAFRVSAPRSFRRTIWANSGSSALHRASTSLAASPQQRFGFQNLSIDTTLLASTFYPGVSETAAAQTIIVIAGETVGGVEFRLLTTAGFKVSGVVVDQTGAPVAGAMVMLRGDPRSAVAIMGPVGQSSSDANGRFVLANVPSGSYSVMVIPTFVSRTNGGDSVESSGISSGGPQAARADPIAVVVADADVDGVTIVVRPRQ